MPKDQVILSRAGRESAPPAIAFPTLAFRRSPDRAPATGRRLAGLLVSATVWLLVFVAVIGAGRHFQSAGYRIITVHGGSMGEAIPAGSLVFAQRQTADDIDVGDVILIRAEIDGQAAAPKLHRVTSIDTDGSSVTVTTQGDANEAADPGVYTLSDQVLVSRLHIPHLGYFMSMVATPLGWFLAVALPFGLTALMALLKIWRVPRPRAAAARHYR